MLLHPRQAPAPVGRLLWLDLEGVAPYASRADTIAYCNTWAGAVAQAGYLPGLYVGANQPLTSDELYWRLKVAHYWKSASRVPDIPVRGFCMIQAIAPSPIDGISLDRNAVQLETMQTLLPVWAVAAQPSRKF